MNTLNEIQIKGNRMTLPTFFPDATRGVIRSLNSQDLASTGVEGVIVNTYHLMSQPGVETLKQLGGIKNFMNWDGWTISDSGGFQIFSLIHRNEKLGKITEDGVQFWLESTGGRTKVNFTPELCIQTQFDIGADIFIVLDDFTPHNATRNQAEKSVERTIRWAERCKDEYGKLCKSRNLTEETRPLLFGVVQGAQYRDLRMKCAIELEQIGFDGYGLGGWVLDEEGKNVDIDLVEYIATLTPETKPKYALGIGDPVSVIKTFQAGYQIFDCVLPTRDARHGRLYNTKRDLDTISLLEQTNMFEYLYVTKGRYVTDTRPISDHCNCATCQKGYSRGYINHLFKIGDSLAHQLATTHNLHTYMKLIENLRSSK